MSIFILATPLLIASLGALFTEYTGSLAIFIDGVINLSAFLCFSISVITGNVFLGFFSALFFCVLAIFILHLFTVKSKANPFLTGLSFNLLATGLTSSLSSAWFGTKGVLTENLGTVPVFTDNSLFFSNFLLSLFTWILLPCIWFFLYKTKCGTYMRITGKSKAVLHSRGIKWIPYQNISWCFAGLFGAIAGCMYALRLESFVPNISAGKGWLALAIVYLGRKNVWGVGLAVVVFTSAEQFANYLQGQAGFLQIPPTILLALPYLLALILFSILPNKKD